MAAHLAFQELLQHAKDEDADRLARQIDQHIYQSVEAHA
jgi:hypothetical protein